jgi:hypothetical protein
MWRSLWRGRSRIGKKGGVFKADVGEEHISPTKPGQRFGVRRSYWIFIK